MFHRDILFSEDNWFLSVSILIFPKDFSTVKEEQNIIFCLWNSIKKKQNTSKQKKLSPQNIISVEKNMAGLRQ